MAYPSDYHIVYTQRHLCFRIDALCIHISISEQHPLDLIHTENLTLSSSQNQNSQVSLLQYCGYSGICSNLFRRLRLTLRNAKIVDHLKETNYMLYTLSSQC